MTIATSLIVAHSPATIARPAHRHRIAAARGVTGIATGRGAAITRVSRHSRISRVVIRCRRTARRAHHSAMIHAAEAATGDRRVKWHADRGVATSSRWSIRVVPSLNSNSRKEMAAMVRAMADNAAVSAVVIARVDVSGRSSDRSAVR